MEGILMLIDHVMRGLVDHAIVRHGLVNHAVV